MAQRSYKDIVTIGDGVKLVAGSFTVSLAGAIQNVLGKGFTIARTAGGTFTVTLDSAFQALIAADASIQPASTPGGLTANVAVCEATFDTAANTIVTIWTLNAAGNPADPGAATTRVSFCFILSDSILNK